MGDSHSGAYHNVFTCLYIYLIYNGPTGTTFGTGTVPDLDKTTNNIQVLKGSRNIGAVE